MISCYRPFCKKRDLGKGSLLKPKDTFMESPCSLKLAGPRSSVDETRAPDALPHSGGSRCAVRVLTLLARVRIPALPLTKYPAIRSCSHAPRDFSEVACEALAQLRRVFLIIIIIINMGAPSYPQVPWPLKR